MEDEEVGFEIWRQRSILRLPLEQLLWCKNIQDDFVDALLVTLIIIPKLKLSQLWQQTFSILSTFWFADVYCINSLHQQKCQAHFLIFWSNLTLTSFIGVFGSFGSTTASSCRVRPAACLAVCAQQENSIGTHWKWQGSSLDECRKMKCFWVRVDLSENPSLTAMIFSCLFRGASSGCFVHLQRAYSCIWFNSYSGCPWDAPGSYSNVYSIWFTSTWSVLVESTTSTIARSVSSWSHHETLSFRSWCWTSNVQDIHRRRKGKSADSEESQEDFPASHLHTKAGFVMLLCFAQKSCWIKSWWMTSMDARIGICYLFQALI